MGKHVRAGDLAVWTEQVGEGPDVLLITLDLRTLPPVALSNSHLGLP
jgi:hypothetical protein